MSNSKSPLASLTMIGLLISVFAKVFGIAVSEHEQQTIMDAVQMLWPILAGMAADFAAAWHRVRAKSFDRQAFESPTFWFTVLSGILTIIAAFGLDVTGFQSLLEKSITAVPAIVALAGVLIALVGRAKATKKIG